jgi:hypothetical protein
MSFINFSKSKFSYNLRPSFEPLQHPAVKCRDVSEECTVSICRLTELFKVDADLIRARNCVGLIGQFEGICPITATETTGA